MPEPIADLLHHSPATRAVLSILRAVEASGCGGLTEPGLEWLLRQRHARSTVRHAVRVLVLTGRVVWTGTKHRRAKSWMVKNTV